MVDSERSERSDTRNLILGMFVCIVVLIMFSFVLLVILAEGIESAIEGIGVT